MVLKIKTDSTLRALSRNDSSIASRLLDKTKRITAYDITLMN